MKRFYLLCKRQLLQPFFLFLCLLLPVSCVFISGLEKTSSSTICIGLYAEAPESFTDAFFSELCSGTQTLSFSVFSDEELMKTLVMRGELDCAYSFCNDFRTRLLNGEYKRAVRCYTSSGTLMKELSKEVVFSSLFKQLGSDILTDYAAALFPAEQDAAGALSSLYEKYLQGSQVFSLEYEYLDADSAKQSFSQAAPVPDASVTMPVQGLIAVFLFVSGLSGGVIWLQDRENRLPVPAFLTIFIPLLFMGGSAGITLFLTGEGHPWGHTLVSLALYLLLVCGFVRVLLLFIKKPAMLSASIPVFVLGSLIFCPIFVNLAALLPFFDFMEKLFLPYYYLLLS